jgi:hypothetical protein
MVYAYDPLLRGIPNLETIKPTNQWNKIFIYKMFPTNTHMLSNFLSIFNLIFHIFFPSDVDCILLPTKLIKIFNPFMVIVNSRLFLYSEFFLSMNHRDLHGIKYKLYFASIGNFKIIFGHEIKFTPCQFLWFIDKKFTV